MTAKKQFALVTLAAFTLAVPGLGDTKKAKERWVEGYAIAHWDIQADGSCTTTQTSVATHLGALTLEGTGVFNFDIGFPIAASGLATGPDGSQSSWENSLGGPITLTSGTGRFEGITGALNLTEIVSGPFYDVDEEGRITAMDVTYTYAGWVTY